MKLYLIRHPAPDVAAGVCYGRSDLGIADGALATALATVHELVPRDLPVRVSPLLRCRLLAQAMHETGWAEAMVEPRVVEMHFGDWEMRLWDDIPREQFNGWRADLLHYTPPGGESLATLAQRCTELLAELRAGLQAGPHAGSHTGPHTGPDDAVALVAHAGPIQILAKLVTGQPLDRFGGHKLGYGSVTLVDVPPVGPGEIVWFGKT